MMRTFSSLVTVDQKKDGPNEFATGEILAMAQLADEPLRWVPLHTSAHPSSRLHIESGDDYHSIFWCQQAQASETPSTVDHSKGLLPAMALSSFASFLYANKCIASTFRVLRSECISMVSSFLPLGFFALGGDTWNFNVQACWQDRWLWRARVSSSQRFGKFFIGRLGRWMNCHSLRWLTMAYHGLPCYISYISMINI